MDLKRQLCVCRPSQASLSRVRRAENAAASRPCPSVHLVMVKVMAVVMSAQEGVGAAVGGGCKSFYKRLKNTSSGTLSEVHELSEDEQKTPQFLRKPQ